MKISKVILTTTLLLNISTSFGMSEFDILTARVCEHLCQGVLVSSKELEGWINTASPDHLKYVSDEYNFPQLVVEEKEELFNALYTIIESDIPNQESRDSFGGALQTLGPQKYTGVAILYEHMPKGILNQ